ncbi:MAG: proton-conducting transporter membrane subunit [Actinomycetota bacterium]|nr:proton-conducting transporter membrane subunit [Actinomycetota bacterium]
MENYLILAAILIPLVGSVAVALVSRYSEEWGAVAATVFCGAALGVVGWLYYLYNQGFALGLSFNVGLPFRLAFRLDALGLFMSLISTLVWVLASIYSLEYITTRKTIFNVFLLLSLYGLLGITMTANLFSLLLFFEVFSVASAVLVMHEGTPEAQRAAFQYLFISIVGSVAIILASAGIYEQTGSLNLMGHGIPGLRGSPLVPLFFWLLIGGFAVKAGMFPVHMWLPEAHPIAPSPASALLSGVMIKAGAYGAIRVIYGIFGMHLVANMFTGKLLLALAVFTMIFGSIMAMTQTELKRMLAYSSVAQIGYVMLGISLLTPFGLTGGVLHIFNHALMKGSLFLAAGVIIHQTGLRNLEDLSGIGKRLPLTMTAFTLSAFSMIGIPPFVGFFSKLYLALGALQAGRSGYISHWSAYGIVAALIVSGLLNIVYYAPIIIRGWFGKPVADSGPAHTHGHGHATTATAHDGGHSVKIRRVEPSWLMLVPMLALAFATLVFGLDINVPLRLVGAVVRLYF